MQKLFIVVMAWVWLTPATGFAVHPQGMRNGAVHPGQGDTLRILAVGNSFSDDAMRWLPDLVREAGVGPVVLARLSYGGCSLEQHYLFHAEGAHNYLYFKTEDNRWQAPKEHVSLDEALRDEPWDVVVVQQVSSLSGVYESYEPWLGALIRTIRLHTDNPRLRIAWHMTWAYASGSSHEGFANYDRDQARMYESIADAARQTKDAWGVDVLIPSGTTIQNLRARRVGGAAGLTRDGYHLDQGVGCYAVACTWFETLIRPAYDQSVQGNTFRIPNSEAGALPVTNQMAGLCQQAVRLAIKQPLKVSR